MKDILILLTFSERYAVDEIDKWMENLQNSDVRCDWKFAGMQNTEPEVQISSMDEECSRCLFGYESDQTLVLTDSREISGICAKKGYVCIGLDPLMETFFDGAEAVAASLEDLDDIYMEETFLRAKGFPVLIAQTDRVRIREIGKKDIPALYEISRQDGMEHAFAEQEQAACFECERMEAYISTVYRFYGYGLWIVETLSGEVIGCCGVSDFSLAEHTADKTEKAKLLFGSEKEVKNWLELQYFVVNRFQNQGYGTEMCRAVIKYVQERLPEYGICVRVHPENIASIRLAERLGFQCFRREENVL